MRGSQPVVTISEVFQSYEEDYKQLIQQLRSLAMVVEGTAPPPERLTAGQDMVDAHERATQAFQQMEFEVKSMGSLGATLAGKLKEYKQELLASRSLPRSLRAHAGHTPKGMLRSPTARLAGRRQFLAELLDLGLRGLLAISTLSLGFVWAGSTAFQRGLVELSTQFFEAASAVGYPSALLWQRGISLYYAGRFKDGASQFRRDVDINSSDTEEAIWAMLCEAQQLGFVAAQQQMMQVGKDPRAIMRLVSELFAGSGQSAQRELEAVASVLPGDKDSFYAALYLGLFEEAQGPLACFG
ncbi:unnamed protein product [Symbiodinium pilosum]|uniref:Vesicle transport v-SNARE N-terminal domain-containing protein n=1 Tax=Symbiodinium pilosum TaxID=2952 RepID=A0A812M2I8_SYMPI|nr:unnamed protein product [Symbiodinium pilosum]